LSKRVVRAIVLILTDDDEEEEEEEEEEDNHSDDSDDADAKRRSNSMRARVFVQSATVKMTKKLVYLGFGTFFKVLWDRERHTLSRERRGVASRTRALALKHIVTKRERERERCFCISSHLLARRLL